MRLKRLSYFSTIGAFIVACISAVIGVWSVYLQKSAQSSPIPEGASVMSAWIMPSILALLCLCILVAAVLHFLAVRMSKDTKPDRKKDKQQGDSTSQDLQIANTSILTVEKLENEKAVLETTIKELEEEKITLESTAKSELDTLKTAYDNRIKELEEEKTALESAAKTDAKTIEQLQHDLNVTTAARDFEQTKAKQLQLDLSVMTEAGRFQENKLKLVELRYGFLHERADKQAKGINEHVEVKKVYYCYDSSEPLPRIVFGVDIYNKSVFDIAIEDAMDGYIAIEGHQLIKDKRVISKSESIAPSCEGYITIEHYLSPEELELIKKRKESRNGAFFSFRNLVIRIKGTDQFSPVESAPLRLPKDDVCNRDKDKLIEYLLLIANNEADNITASVEVENVIPTLNRSQSAPSVIFEFWIRNNSVFEISIDEAIDGHVLFDDRALTGQMIVRPMSGRIPASDLGHRKQGVFSFELLLNPEEANLVFSTEKKANFYFNELIINIKGSERFRQVDSQRLYIQRGVHKDGGMPRDN